VNLNRSLLLKAVVAVGLCVVIWNLTSRLRVDRSRAASPSLSVTPARLMIAPRGETEKQRETSFKISNHGSNPVTISRIETSCMCTSLVNLDGKNLLPGAELEVPITVDIPQYGFKSVNIRVFSSDSAAPVTVYVDVNGVNKLPVILDVTPKDAIFFDLADREQITQGEVKTRERISDKNWIESFHASDKNLQILIDKVITQTDDDNLFVDRTYLIRFKWATFPETRDFHFRYWPVDQDSTELPFLGFVDGNLK